MTRTKIQNSSLSFDGGSLSGFRNAIINGNFDFWQRGTSFTGNEYGADRWINLRIGSACTMSRQAFTLGQTDVPNEPTYFCRMAVTSVAGANNYAILDQRIEDVRSFAGQQVTVSFWAKADATKNIAVEFQQYFGTGGSPSANVNTIGTTKVSIGTTWQKITVTASVPSINGKTLGSDANSFIHFFIWFDAGSNFNSRTNSLGQQSGTFDIAQVQVERGPVATPFERRPIGTELSLCQRYYYRHKQDSIWYGYTIQTSATNSNRYWSFSYPVEMRGTPIADTTALTFTLSSGTGSIGSVSASVNFCVFRLSANITEGVLAFVDNGAYMSLSAEL